MFSACIPVRLNLRETLALWFRYMNLVRVVVLTVSQDIIRLRFILLIRMCCTSKRSAHRLHFSSYASGEFSLIKHSSCHLISMLPPSTLQQPVKTLPFFCLVQETALLLGQYWITNWSGCHGCGRVCWQNISHTTPNAYNADCLWYTVGFTSLSEKLCQFWAINRLLCLDSNYIPLRSILLKASLRV